MAVAATEISIGRGVFTTAILPPRSERRQVAILSQPGAQAIARGIGETLAASGLLVGVIDVPDGEAAKTLQTAERIYAELNRRGLSRDDTVLAVGGGAVTDFGGFIAATYLRGIEAVYCATTLLGAVDAAIGGKTGINVGGKNLVGVFSHPSRVVVDLDVLDVLPEDLRIQGMAEVLKAGLIGDLELVDLLERDGLGADLDQVVRRAVAVKMSVVEGDFREAGRRAILNYGHTIGHAVEIVAGISHGEAVAIGMVAAGVVSEQLVGFDEADRVTRVIESLGLPVGAPGGLDRGRMLQLVGLDKKRDTSGIRMVLLEAIGRPVVQAVDETIINSALDAILPHQ
ncbi:MAG: 3-dehydroquinate synthase [Acidimicrobiia bacterium]|nr:3-dehydroquinate synthase [Acidimicrobiia bacterium]